MAYEDLERLHDLHAKGALSDEEFEREKAKVLAREEPAPSGASPYWGMSKETFLMLMHLSQLASFVVPLSGAVIPIVMWVTAKDQDAEVDRHGRVILNWIISSFIYGIVFALLCLILIGIPLLIALILLTIIYPIVGGVKANDGVLWRYPLSIPFFTVDPRDRADW